MFVFPGRGRPRNSACAITLYLMKKDRKLLERRMSGGPALLRSWSVGRRHGSSLGRQRPALNTPCNAATNRPYSGSNIVLLWMAANAGYRTPRYLTFKQALDLGGNVRKGEHGMSAFVVVLQFKRVVRTLARASSFQTRRSSEGSKTAISLASSKPYF
jgi:N-terminal domain of anti-restriction factor ArdC